MEYFKYSVTLFDSKMRNTENSESEGIKPRKESFKVTQSVEVGELLLCIWNRIKADNDIGIMEGMKPNYCEWLKKGGIGKLQRDMKRRWCECELLCFSGPFNKRDASNFFL